MHKAQEKQRVKSTTTHSQKHPHKSLKKSSKSTLKTTAKPLTTSTKSFTKPKTVALSVPSTFSHNSSLPITTLQPKHSKALKHNSRSFSTDNVNHGFAPNPYPSTAATRTTTPSGRPQSTRTESYDDLKQRISKFNEDVTMDNYQPIDADAALFPTSATLDRLRKIAPSSRPESLQHVKNVQRGNFNIPSPFSDNMVDSTQRIQQHFQKDQREELYPSDQVDLGQDAKANVGTIGSLEDDDEERTFSRTIFYGFGPNHVVMNGMAFQGSVLATPTMTYLWKPRKWEEVTAESLSVLSFLFPQPDVIIFGCGPTAKAIDPSAHHFLRTLNIPYELMGTYNAMGTFNLMNEEYRKVVAFTISYDHSQSFEKALANQEKKDVI